jgi:hypothetical protein
MTAEHGTILDIDTSDAIEPQAVEAGEYKVRITGFRKDNEGNIVRTSQNGNKYFITVFDIPDEPASKGLSHILSVPTEDMDPKRLNGVKWQLELLKRAFGLTEINFDSMIGREGYAMLTLDNDPEYGEQNRIQKFIVGA